MNIGVCRTVDIEITNFTKDYWLKNPKFYLFSGNCESPPQPTVLPQQTEWCSFSRNFGFCGAVGVLTYDLFMRRCRYAKEKVAIMFSVPYDYIEHEDWVAIGIYTDDKKCDEALYKEMYYNCEKSDSEKHGFVRKKAKDGGLTFKGSSVDIKATMSPVGHSVMKVEVWDKP